MSKEKLTYVNEAITQAFDNASPETQKVSLYGWDSTNAQKTRLSVNSNGILEGLQASTDFEGSPVTIGTTAVEITFTGTTSSIMIESDVENTGFVYVGKSNVTNSGANAMTKLEPGASITIELNDSSNAIYAVSDTAGQTVYKMALL